MLAQLFITQKGESRNSPEKGGPDQNPNFLRNFCLLDMRLEKKVPQTCPKIQGGGVKAVQQKSKVELLFFPCGFPYPPWVWLPSLAMVTQVG